MNKFDFALILTCTINPVDIPNLVRNDPDLRFKDYKKSFNFWTNHPKINKIIFIENSNYDINYFKNFAKDKSKRIEFFSNNLNDTFNKKLGKGYGQYLCFKEVFEKSSLVKETGYFFNVTGRHIITNFDEIYKDMILKKNDIYINLTDNLKFCNTTSFGASKRFITNYFLPEAKKTSDLENLILERNMSRAVLKAVADGLILSNVPVYSHLKGFIGTNGKELKFNFFKKIKLYFFRKLKMFFMSHKKY